jgi:hypothetical protein
VADTGRRREREDGSAAGAGSPVARGRGGAIDSEDDPGRVGNDGVTDRGRVESKCRREAAMGTTSAVAGSATMPVEPPMVPITVPMFRAMVRSGIIGEKEPVYLWKGRLARRMAPNRPHSIAVDRGRRALEAILPAGYHVQQGQPVAMRRQHSTPEPDLAVLRGRPEDYPQGFPTSADMPLVVEVADTSMALDRDQAGDLALEGVPVYLIVDLKGRRVEVRDHPRDGSYERVSIFHEDDELPIVVDGREVGRVLVRDLLP